MFHHPYVRDEYFGILFSYRFGLFAAVSCLLKGDMTPHLEGMVKQMIESLNSSEGITVSLGLLNKQYCQRLQLIEL